MSAVSNFSQYLHPMARGLSLSKPAYADCTMVRAKFTQCENDDKIQGKRDDPRGPSLMICPPSRHALECSRELPDVLFIICLHSGV